MRRRVLTAAVVTLGTALLAGCSGSDSGSSARDYLSRPATGGDSAGGETAAASSAPAPGIVVAPPGSSRSPQSPSVLPGASVIRTASLTVTVSKSGTVATRADSAADLVARLGGEVASDDRYGGRYARASLQLRVPTTELQPTLRVLSTYGTASQRQVSSRDVTGQVADVKSRVTSAARAIARLRVLYDGAAKVSDVIAIEQELSTREADLESLQAQQRALAGQASLATITLTIRATPADAAPPRDHRTGFLGGLANGWDAFTRALTGLATGVGAALPFLALLAVLGLVARVVVVRIRRRRPAPQPATE